MELTSSLIVRVTTSRASLPVEGATVAVTVPAENGRQTLVALTETNANGLAGPITLTAPTTDSNGTRPGGPPPYSFYSLWVEHPGYQLVHIQDVQVFPRVMSVQDISLVPLSASVPLNGGALPGAQPQEL